jgi:hypothetical protein
LRILFLTSGREVPASRFRVLQYVPYLESRGHVCTVLPSWPEKYRGLRFLGNRLSEPLRIVRRTFEALQEAIDGHDVTFVEREILSSRFAGLEQLFRRASRRMVLDVDDAIFLLNPGKFERLVGMADYVIVGNAALRDVVLPRTAAASIIPTVVDTAAYDRAHRSAGEARVDAAQTLRMGWIGTAYNYQYLEPVLPALRPLIAQHSLELHLVAERPPSGEAFAGLPLRFERWSAEREVELVQSFDVGLMPLRDDEWARYKCGAKILQYMAAGIPSIASPVGANCEIVRHGETGLLARNVEEWRDALTTLIDDEGLRERMGAAARRRVDAEYSVDRWAPVLEQTLREVVESPSCWNA